MLEVNGANVPVMMIAMVEAIATAAVAVAITTTNAAQVLESP
jgi:hypothetical protein